MQKLMMFPLSVLREIVAASPARQHEDREPQYRPAGATLQEGEPLADQDQMTYSGMTIITTITCSLPHESYITLNLHEFAVAKQKYKLHGSDIKNLQH